ncbi:hypothetical protein QR680_004020 [Steinernema hermaphroditum]|uniref:RRM domain-containing protein n=1 Tax=Steinernema hermaphroditum TaxID=289476 RepID=A0AA39HNG5_9BILA|nr:hypothetical protein QR680_004020 [Steinernema hermaphroditum]
MSSPFWRSPSPPSPHRRRLPPSPPPLTRIYISNLTKHLTKAHVEEIFGKFGTVKRCELPPKTHHEYFNRGRALLEFEKAEEAIKAQRYMDGGQIDGLRVKVILSHQSPNRQYAQYPVRRSHGSPSRRRSPPSKHGSPPRSCRDGMNRGRRYSRSRSPPRRPDGHRL